MPHVTHPERAFLQLVAKRVLRFQRDALARNEEYVDLAGFAPLGCGARVKCRFVEAPGGYVSAVYLKTGVFPPEVLKEIATELLEGPVTLRTVTGDDLEYVRENDAVILTP